MPSDLVIGIDPSSTRTGYAILGARGNKVIDAGYFRENAKAAPIVRIHSMAKDLLELLTDGSNVAEAIIEIPSGHVGARHKGGGAGLSVYGMAVGAIYWAAVQALGEEHVHTTREDIWTRGIPKAKRTARLAALFPGFRKAFKNDAGGDVADAIGLVRYWFQAMEARAIESRATDVASCKEM